MKFTRYIKCPKCKKNKRELLVNDRMDLVKGECINCGYGQLE